MKQFYLNNLILKMMAILLEMIEKVVCAYNLGADDPNKQKQAAFREKHRECCHILW